MRPSPASMCLIASSVLIGALSASTAAVGAERPAAWTLAPYVWAPTFSGRIELDGQRVDIDVRTDELAGSIKAGAMGYVRRVQGPHMVYAEGLGVDFEDESLDQFRGLPVAAKLLSAEAGYGYQLAFDSALPNGGQIVITPYGGVRYARFAVRVTSPLPLLIDDLSADERWVDPVLGLLVEGPVAGPVSYAFKLDGAGFGWGRDRYFSAAVYLTARLSEHWLVGGGYRDSQFDASPGGDNELDMELRGSGPMLGLAYLW